MVSPLVSIIIPTHNSEKTIELCIDSLVTQTYPRDQFEIIVVDDGSEDRTVDIAKRTGADLVVITEPCFQGKARNIGVTHAKSNFLAFIDSDCRANNSWIRTVINELKPSCGISGPIKNGNPESLVAWSEYFLEFVKFNEYKKRSSISFLPGCNAAYTKEDYQRVGGFVEFESSEDILLGMALRNSGVNLYFIPEMTIEHLCRTELNKVMKNSQKRGKFFVITGRKEPSLPHSYLIKSRWKIPIIFFGRTYLSIIRSINAKKFSKFFLAFPLILLGISSLCRGIWDETGKMNPEKKS